MPKKWLRGGPPPQLAGRGGARRAPSPAAAPRPGPPPFAGRSSGLRTTPKVRSCSLVIRYFSSASAAASSSLAAWPANSGWRAIAASISSRNAWGRAGARGGGGVGVCREARVRRAWCAGGRGEGWDPMWAARSERRARTPPARAWGRIARSAVASAGAAVACAATRRPVPAPREASPSRPQRGTCTAALSASAWGGRARRSFMNLFVAVAMRRDDWHGAAEVGRGAGQGGEARARRPTCRGRLQARRRGRGGRLRAAASAAAAQSPRCTAPCAHVLMRRTRSFAGSLFMSLRKLSNASGAATASSMATALPGTRHRDGALASGQGCERGRGRAARGDRRSSACQPSFTGRPPAATTMRGSLRRAIGALRDVSDRWEHGWGCTSPNRYEVYSACHHRVIGQTATPAAAGGPRCVTCLEPCRRSNTSHTGLLDAISGQLS